MTLPSELHEYSVAFKKLGPLGKLLVFGGAFSSASALASFADYLIKWKGFFLDAITLYRVAIASPIKYVADRLSFDLTLTEIDSIVLSSIAISAGMRIAVQGQLIAFDEINKKYNSDLKPNLTAFFIIPIIAIILMFISAGLTSAERPPWLQILVFFTFPIFLVGPKYLLNKINPNRFVYFEKDRFSYLKSYYVAIGALFLFVGFMGAINSVFFN